MLPLSVNCLLNIHVDMATEHPGLLVWSSSYTLNMIE